MKKETVTCDVKPNGFKVYYKGFCVAGAGTMYNPRLYGKVACKTIEQYTKQANVIKDSILRNDIPGYIKPAINKIDNIHEKFAKVV